MVASCQACELGLASDEMRHTCDEYRNAKPFGWAEHREGVCLSARKTVAYMDGLSDRLWRACEAFYDGDADLAFALVRTVADDLRVDASFVGQLVESFTRRASVRH